MANQIIKTNKGLVQTSQEEVTNLANQAGLQAPPTNPNEVNVIGGTPDQAKMAGTPAQTQAALRISTPVEAEQATVERRKEVKAESPSAEAQAKADRIMQLGSLNTRLEGLIEQYKRSQIQPGQDQAALEEAVAKGQSAAIGAFSGWQEGSPEAEAAANILGPNWQSMTVAEVEAKIRAEQSNTLDEVAQIQRQLADPALPPSAKQALRERLRSLSVGGTYATEAMAERGVEKVAATDISPAKQEWAEVASGGDQELQAQLLNTDDDMLRTLTRMPPQAIKQARDYGDKADSDIRQILGLDTAVEFIVDKEQQAQIDKVAPVVSGLRDAGLGDVLANDMISEDIGKAIVAGELTAADIPAHAAEWDKPIEQWESVKRLTEAADIAVARPTEDNLNMLIKEVFGESASSESINAMYMKALDIAKYDPTNETAKRQIAQFKELDKDQSGKIDAKDITGLADMIKLDKIPSLVDLLKGSAEYTPGYNTDYTTMAARPETAEQEAVSSLVKTFLSDSSVTEDELMSIVGESGNYGDPAAAGVFDRLNKLDLTQLGARIGVPPYALKSPEAFRQYKLGKAMEEGNIHGYNRLGDHGGWDDGTIAQVLDFGKGPRISRVFNDADLAHMNNVLGALRKEQQLAETQGSFTERGQAAGLKKWADMLELSINNIVRSHQMADEDDARRAAEAKAAREAAAERDRAAQAAAAAEEALRRQSITENQQWFDPSSSSTGSTDGGI